MQTTAAQAHLSLAIPDPEQPPRLFQCSTCKRSFTRVDHLTRHVRAHTRSKPYVCPVCTKPFARVDLLKRHVKNHDSEPTSKRPKRETTRDARAMQACEACSQSHLRCEDEKPCRRCNKKGIPCRVPESSTMDGSETHETATVHAAQDLLHFSTGFDGLPSAPGLGQGASIPPFAEMNGLRSQRHLGEPQLPPSGSTASTLGQQHELHPHNSQEPLVRPNVMQLPYHTAPAPAPWGFSGQAMVRFDEPPAHNPFPPEYFQNLPLDFSFNMDTNLTDADLGLLDEYNFQLPFVADTPSSAAQDPEPQFPDSANVPEGTEAFKQSIWRFLPQRNKDFGSAEQVNLAFSDDKDDKARAHLTQRRVISEKLDRIGRDRMMAFILGTCKPENVRHIASAFPSVMLLDGLIQYFLTSPSLDAQSWLHLPTFSPSKISPELLACIVSAGAATTPDISLRKLGLALQEASRSGQSKAFEEDNTAIRDFQHLQNLFLQLKIGMWSGISRKMEIAESFLQPLVTMLRRGGRFRRSIWKELSPSADAVGEALETEWLAWVHQESFLRLVFRVFELDRESSMALLKPPLISYSEMQLPVPSANFLWQAKSASKWKAAYLDATHISLKRRSATECFLEFRLVHRDHASTAYLNLIWGMVWEYRQMADLSKSQPRANNGLALSSRHQELTRQLENFSVNSVRLTKSAEVTLELMFLHLNASIDDIQLFAGIQGQEEARAAYPRLREWTKSVSARQALWHAGQVLHAAEGLSKGLLCDFNAVAVYHAGLVLWAYGFLKRSISETVLVDPMQASAVVNGDNFLHARRFTMLERGLPAIQSAQSQKLTLLSDISGVMDDLIYLLTKPHGTAEGCPPLVSNLVQLLKGLRSAMRA